MVHKTWIPLKCYIQPELPFHNAYIRLNTFLTSRVVNTLSQKLPSEPGNADMKVIEMVRYSKSDVYYEEARQAKSDNILKFDILRKFFLRLFSWLPQIWIIMYTIYETCKTQFKVFQENRCCGHFHGFFLLFTYKGYW